MSAPLGAAWPDVVDDRLAVGGREVRVLRVPARGRSAHEPQLLVHGLGGSSVTWAPVLEGLARRGPVAALDLPGFGRTPAAERDPLTVDGYVDVVLATADALGWDRFTLHGNSMGGLIGTLLAAERPGRVGRLVLVSPALPPPSPLRLLLPARATVSGLAPVAVSSLSAVALGVVGAAAPALDERRNRALLRLIFADPAGVDGELLDLMAREYAAEPAGKPSVLRALLRALSSIARLWADPRRVWRAIDAVTAPTLLLGGTADALVPARVLRQVAARRPDWSSHVLDDRRHALMMESPADYLALVEEWHRSRRVA